MKKINIDVENQILTALQNVGFAIDVIKPDMLLGGILYDSLAFITFIIELEQLLNIEIPAESFSIGWLDKSLKEVIDILENLC